MLDVGRWQVNDVYCLCISAVRLLFEAVGTEVLLDASKLVVRRAELRWHRSEFNHCARTNFDLNLELDRYLNDCRRGLPVFWHIDFTLNRYVVQP